MIHEPAVRSRERNKLRGQGWSKTLLEGSAQGPPILQPYRGSALLQLHQSTECPPGCPQEPGPQVLLSHGSG